MSMKLTRKEVEHLAKLARLALTESEIETYRAQLSDVLQYVSQLNLIDTDDVPPTRQVTGQVNELREDVVVSCDPETRDNIVAQFPDRDGDLLRVPAVFN